MLLFYYIGNWGNKLAQKDPYMVPNSKSSQSYSQHSVLARASGRAVYSLCNTWTAPKCDLVEECTGPEGFARYLWHLVRDTERNG